MRFFETLLQILYIPSLIIGVWIHEIRGLWDKEPGQHVEPKWKDGEEVKK